MSVGYIPDRQRDRDRRGGAEMRKVTKNETQQNKPLVSYCRGMLVVEGK